MASHDARGNTLTKEKYSLRGENTKYQQQLKDMAKAKAPPLNKNTSAANIREKTNKRVPSATAWSEKMAATLTSPDPETNNQMMMLTSVKTQMASNNTFYGRISKITKRNNDRDS